MVSSAIEETAGCEGIDILFQAVNKFIAAAATGFSPASGFSPSLLTEGILYFFVLYSVSKKIRRMAEQFEKLQVEMKKSEKQKKNG